MPLVENLNVGLLSERSQLVVVEVVEEDELLARCSESLTLVTSQLSEIESNWEPRPPLEISLN